MRPGSRNSRAWSPWTRFAAVTAYGAAMGHFEGVLVYYLRKLLEVDPAEAFVAGQFHFPATYLRVEQSRNVATVIMLVAVGYLAGRNAWQKVAYFLLAFGVWDITYYVSLKVLLDWPSSLAEQDLLFLVPHEWWGPVYEPVLFSVAFIVFCVVVLLKTRDA